MKQVDVNKQVRLPLSKTVELVVSGVRFRLFRAAVTVVIIALAVAFLMTMLSESVIGRNVAAAIEEKTAPRKTLGFWVGQLTSALTVPKLTDNVAELTPGSLHWTELRDWGELTDEQLTRLAALSQLKQMYLAFFDELTEGDRRALVGRDLGLDIFEHLRDSDRWAVFLRELPNVGVSFPGEGADTFKAFLTDWHEAQPQLGAIIAGHSKAFQAFRDQHLKRSTIDEYLAVSPADLPELLAGYGYQMAPEDVATVRSQASLRRDADRIGKLFRAPLVRQAVKEAEDLEKANEATVDMLFELVASDSGVEWLFRELARMQEQIDELPADIDTRADQNLEDRMIINSRSIETFSLPKQRVVEVAKARLADKHLQRVEKHVSMTTSAGGYKGFSSRTVALLVVSFMVCIVGIANAMLMSVTERFREIATMKCLGATDGFIMVNFILESCMQGIAGGVIGVILGAALGIGRSWAAYGSLALTQIPVLEVVGAAILSFVLGVVISALAAVYPASVAARLAPMEAMRIE